jgi:hypothetical protein
MSTITFKSGRNTFEATPENGYFMDNGACIQFIKTNVSNDPSPIVSAKEWKRIKPLLKNCGKQTRLVEVEIYKVKK